MFKYFSYLLSKRPYIGHINHNSKPNPAMMPLYLYIYMYIHQYMLHMIYVRVIQKKNTSFKHSKKRVIGIPINVKNTKEAWRRVTAITLAPIQNS